MPTAKEELKAHLLAQAEAAIEAMLQDSKVNPQMSLSEMEKSVGELGDKLEQDIMQVLVNRSQATEAKLCPSCGGKLRNKGKRPKRLVTVRGEIEVKRDYYVCVDCNTGYFPPR